MAEDEIETPRGRPTPPIDGPTVMGPSTGNLQGPAPEEPPLPAAPARGADPDEPTVAATTDDTAPATPPTAWPDDPTVATPISDITHLEPGNAEPTTWLDGPTVVTPVDAAASDESPTTTGSTVGGWPLDELLPPPPTDLAWRPDTPEPPPAPRRPAYYVALGASVVLVVALVAAAALVTVLRPTREVVGTASPGPAIPEITGSAPPPAPTTTTGPPPGPATHPLSSSPARMADATCALPRFDLADDRQAAFYAAARTCADDAWRGVLAGAGLEGTVEVVTVTSPVRTGSCGEILPASPSTQCDGTVYMTPAHLRDTERNGRYPGRYFGVFLREYARALQFTTGLAELAAAVDDAEARLAQQATCLAGVASGAMANRGAVDANITGEISDRLSSVDAPPDAKVMLDKGFQERTLKACNTW
ncbi:MAG: hypothetical protein WBA97_12840 [Actinophytocola sp.]|uniref:hypothetical protein n=1 Tax=Actinophytocola sp. TaxID=1872138 RepID=UPI003C72E202